MWRRLLAAATPLVLVASTVSACAHPCSYWLSVYASQEPVIQLDNKYVANHQQDADIVGELNRADDTLNEVISDHASCFTGPDLSYAQTLLAGGW